jgi:hypothetical protein
MQTKKIYSSKDPRYNLRTLTIAMKDVLHIHRGHDDSYNSGKITDQLRPFCLPGVIREPGCHLTEVLASAERQRDEGHAGPLLDSNDPACSQSSIRRTSQRQASSISWRETASCSSNDSNKKIRRSGVANNKQDDKMKSILTHNTAWVSVGHHLHSSGHPLRGPESHPDGFKAALQLTRLVGGIRVTLAGLVYRTDELMELTPIIRGRP